MENKKVEEITSIVLNKLGLFINGIVCNAKDDITWITVKGNHIPIKKGQTISEAMASFFESKKNKSGKQNKEATNKDYEKILSDVKQSNEKDITADDILEEITKNDKFPYSIEEVKEKIDFAEKYNKDVIETITKYRDKDGKYTAKRNQLHKEIIRELFANAENAKPEKGKEPTFTMLGGRGGSGKSKFKDLVYDPKKNIVLDADAIKEKLPEYRGYNAYEVHEESSDILNKALKRAKKKGLNVVLDATMKTEKSTKKKLKDFLDAGYNIEMHYMHLPREKSAQRAVGRYMGAGGRYVPLKVILNDMKHNEETFDSLKKYADKWSFYVNDGATKEDPPRLIAKS